ncbi:MAG: peptidoglycan DD-metalloendopeptidase family protein [Lachnospiraceae bacterium]|nr:peptidoglycan DD-metalloendopeptidase family protein [Lachnospiraceae bacterium]
MKQWKYRVSFILGMIMVCGALSVPSIVVRATNYENITSDSIKEKQNQISQAQQEKNVLQSGLTDVKKIMNELQSSKNNLEQYVTKLDSSLNSIEQKLSELKSLIDQKLKEIETTRENLRQAEEIEKAQYEAMKERIRFMYEKGDNFYLEMMLSAKSFGEFLNKADYVNMLSEYDRNMLDEYRATREAIELLKAELEEEQKTLEEAKAAAEEEEAAMETLIQAKEQEINLYESDITNKSQLVKEYEAEIAAQNATIAALEKAVAEEKKRIAEANGSVRKYDGGQFAWPAPSYKRISDDYGTRIHPILKVQQFHNGVDMAAPSGSPILAAYDGTVVQAAYSSTMGNYIMLDHGDGLYTIYMHASALGVSKGATVTKGQNIGAIGSTGRSTGPHLHFSVRLNGSYVSPWNYLQ